MPAEWLKDVREADEDGLLALTGICRRRPPRRSSNWRRVERRTWRRPSRRLPACRARSVHPSRRAAPVPRGDQRRRTGARAGRALGQVDGLPPPRAASAGRRETTTGLRAWRVRLAPERPSSPCIAPFIWPARCRRAASCSRRSPSRLAHALRTNVKRLIGQRATRARTSRSALDERPRPTPAPGADRPCRASRQSEDVDTLLREAVEGGRRPQVLAAVPSDRVGAGRRCLAAWNVGGVSRRPAARPPDTASRSAARSAVGNLRAGASGPEGSRPDDRVGRLSGAGGRSVRPSHACLRRRGRRRSPGHQHRAAAVPCGARRRPAERPVLLRRPRPAHLPAAVLMEGARRGRSRPVEDPARELPDVTPDPRAGRPTARP